MTRRREGIGAGGELPVVWTDRALADLEEIGAYIAADNPVAAERWVSSLVAAVAKAAFAPFACRRVPEVGRDDIREALLRRYRVVYRVTNERLEVLTVFEGHRLFPEDVESDEI